MGRADRGAGALGLSGDRGTPVAATPLVAPDAVPFDEFRFLTLVYAPSMVLANPIVVGMADLFLFQRAAGGSGWLVVLPFWLLLSGGSLIVARRTQERVLGALLTGSTVLWLGLIVVGPGTGDPALGVTTAVAIAALAVAPMVLYTFSAELARDRDEASGFRRLGLAFGLAVAVLTVVWNLIPILPRVIGPAGLLLAADAIWYLILVAMFAAAVASTIAFLQMAPTAPSGLLTVTNRGG